MSSFLVQLLLPKKTNDREFSSNEFRQVRKELADKFGGVTVYSRSTADGLWEGEEGVMEQDEVVLFEVMTAKAQAKWWRRYRHELEGRFEQTEIVVRLQRIRRL